MNHHNRIWEVRGCRSYRSASCSSCSGTSPSLINSRAILIALGLDSSHCLALSKCPIFARSRTIACHYSTYWSPLFLVSLLLHFNSSNRRPAFPATGFTVWDGERSRLYSWAPLVPQLAFPSCTPVLEFIWGRLHSLLSTPCSIWGIS